MTVDTILGVQAVCARIGVSRATLSRMEKQGTFPARAAGKKPASWQSSQVETWLSERENVEAERTGAVCINTTEPCAYACDAALLRVYLAELDSSLAVAALLMTLPRNYAPDARCCVFIGKSVGASETSWLITMPSSTIPLRKSRPKYSRARLLPMAQKPKIKL